MLALLLRLPVGYGGVLNSPRFWFFFPCRKSGYRSWVIPLCSIPIAIWDSEPISTRLLNSISSRICRQNTQFNMYTTTSKQQEGCTFKDSHPKCFITTNFNKFHREAFARDGESRWCFDSMFPWYTKSKVNSNGVCNYYDFIRREGLSLAIWFDIVEFRENIHMTVKIFANVHQLMFSVLKLVWIRIEYSLVQTALNRWCFKIR